MMNQVIPEGLNREPALNWARYQFAVTKQNNDKAQSSYMYSMFDPMNQVINFQNYIDDDESIVDQVCIVCFCNRSFRPRDMPLIPRLLNVKVRVVSIIYVVLVKS